MEAVCAVETVCGKMIVNLFVDEMLGCFNSAISSTASLEIIITDRTCLYLTSKRVESSSSSFSSLSGAISTRSAGVVMMSYFLVFLIRLPDLRGSGWRQKRKKKKKTSVRRRKDRNNQPSRGAFLPLKDMTGISPAMTITTLLTAYLHFTDHNSRPIQ